MDVKNTRAIGDEIEALVGEFSNLPDPRARQRVEKLVALLMELYGAGIARILEIARHEGAGTLPSRLAEDPLVGSLLVLHGLHPLDTRSRIEQALHQVRPYLASHGGDVTLLAFEDGVAHLKLQGSCHGCGSSPATLKLAVEQAIQEAAPEVTRFEVEGLPGGDDALIQIQRPGARRAPTEAPVPAGDWVTLSDQPELRRTGMAAIEISGLPLVVCQVGDLLYAYRDLCTGCRSRLEGGTLQDAVLLCPSCGRRYDVRLAGRCLDAGGFQLEPLPLLQDKGAVRIAVPAAS